MGTRKYKFGKRKDGADAVVSTDGSQATATFRNLHVLITPSGKGFLAQAYQIDYAVYGKDLDQVKQRFETGLTATVHHYIEIYGEIDNLLRQVNTDWWSLRKAASPDGHYGFSSHSTHELVDLPFQAIEYETLEAIAA
jgi:hypothetical protein